MEGARRTSSSAAGVPASITDFVRLIQWRALAHGERLACTFLADGEVAESCLTYGALDRRARAVGALLQSFGAGGERVLLLYPPSLDYIAAFLGCLYAGAVPVPAYPPRHNRNLIRLQAIVEDAQATVALTAPSVRRDVDRMGEASALKGLRWLDIEGVDDALADSYRPASFSEQQLAFLQYTSGSTSKPKGVMVSHGNLFTNSAFLQQIFESRADSRFVIWLPPYHDMGLIAGVLQPFFVGCEVTLMAPAAFLQRPLRWLRAMSACGGTISGAPNFAYDLCASRATPEALAELDLSRWETAFNGAEPVRAETLDRFATTFEPCGFRREALLPCYGLAEATVGVSGVRSLPRPAPAVVRTYDASALKQNRVSEAAAGSEDGRNLVGCGRSPDGQEVVIVHPESLRRCQPEEVGEIWVSGPHVAQGYLNRPEETRQVFDARLADGGEGPFLRTGDLGFLREAHLFVTGRLKDLIIIRGQNHYPQDIEWTVEQSYPQLRKGCGAVFVREDSGDEGLIVVQEVDRAFSSANTEEAFRAIRRAVTEAHGLQVSAVRLIKRGSIPKTSSGKIQRHACRSAFLDDALSDVPAAVAVEVPAGVERGATPPSPQE